MNQFSTPFVLEEDTIIHNDLSSSGVLTFSQDDITNSDNYSSIYYNNDSSQMSSSSDTTSTASSLFSNLDYLKSCLSLNWPRIEVNTRINTNLTIKNVTIMNKCQIKSNDKILNWFKTNNAQSSPLKVNDKHHQSILIYDIMKESMTDSINNSTNTQNLTLII
jgi:hypothetical protein